jgi:DNA polymerase I
MLDELPYREIWVIDFEFRADPGEVPKPICLVAWELRSGRKVRIWWDALGSIPPYPTGPKSLVVAYYASAEFGCHLALDWPVPEHVLDLYTEFRNHTNGLELPSGRGLIGALAYFGLDSIGVVEKKKCGILSCEADHGRMLSGRRFLTIAKVTLRP